MNKATTENLTSLLEQAQELMAGILRRFEERLKALVAEAADPTAQHWTRELAAGQTRVELRSVHRQIAYAIRIMQLRDVISEGEAAPISQALNRLLAESLDETERRLQEARRDRRTRRSGAAVAHRQRSSTDPG